ncbi:MAG TPA: pantetheine-phosphate adenylyltransferase [Anaerovoracaceae bacterium]|nr:pantetheine-phosphate adenylyltransferase [Anaerovoracaceae bacterium]
MKRALYAGSFDPITCGHLDIIKRASKMYDEVTVGVINNPSKKPLFSVDERKDMVKLVTSELDNIVIDSFSGLLAKYVNENKFDIVIRGLRATTDFEYELQMAQMNARLFNQCTETVFLMTNPKYSFISSSMIKEVVMLGGDVDGLVIDEIFELTKKKFNGR